MPSLRRIASTVSSVDTTTETTISGFPLLGYITGYYIELVSGDGTTIRPSVSRWSNNTRIVFEENEAAYIQSRANIRIPFQSHGGNLYFSWLADAGANNVIQYEIFYEKA